MNYDPGRARVNIPTFFDDFVDLVRTIYPDAATVPLHAPSFGTREKQTVMQAIESTFVSSVGKEVDRFERSVAEYTGSRFAVATVNGTSALHLALLLAGVARGDLVVTQSLTFVATCNAIKYCGADPVLIDVESASLGMSPESLARYLEHGTRRHDTGVVDLNTGRPLKAVLPVHSFGHPAQIEKITAISASYGLPVVEDSAEALGSRFRDRHVGTFGAMGVLSFNGNKIITTGGGGMLLTDDADRAHAARHLSSTGKVPHAWRYEHDRVAYNYRMPNINAALGLGQMPSLADRVESKRRIAARYRAWAHRHSLPIIDEPAGTFSNYWLVSLLMADRQQRDQFIEYTHAADIMTRPAWEPMHSLSMFRDCARDELACTRYLADRIVNVPSSALV